MRQLFYYTIQHKFITKCVRFFITKCDSFVTKCDSYYKLRQFYYKLRQSLQNATFITNCDSTGLQLVNLFLYTIQGLVTYLGKDIFQEKRKSLLYFW